ncbi:MAG: helicase, partial [Calditrichota bacterium]
MVGATMELRRLGLSRKNLFVVPKATHGQFKNQFKDIYPYADVLFPSEDDFSAGKRGEFITRASTGDWDAIILTGDQFRNIEVRPETERRFLTTEINELRAALEAEIDENGKGRTSKAIEKAVEKAEVRLKNVADRLAAKHEHTINFEDLGIDQLFVDEADNYKNLHFATRMGRLKGLPNSDSDRAFDMYMKTRTLQEQSNGQGVVFATGTPIANTVAEMYTMMRYLQEPMLESKGLQHFDTWAKTFGETTEGLEQNAAGKYLMTQRFSKFVNIPELSNIWQQTADIRVADEVPAMRAEQPII